MSYRSTHFVIKFWQGDISKLASTYFFGAICPVGMFFVPTGQLAPKKHALRLTWEMSAWEMSPCHTRIFMRETRLFFHENFWKFWKNRF